MTGWKKNYLDRLDEQIGECEMESENMKLRTILSDLYDQFGMLEHKFERAGGVWHVAHKGFELGGMSWASNVENSIHNMRNIFDMAKKEMPQEPVSQKIEETI